MHRLKADEAYQIGEAGHPVRAYLDVAEIIARRAAGRAPTRSTPATASSPRTPSSPTACDEAGITFIGPPAARARRWPATRSPRKEHAAREAGVPVLESPRPVRRRRRRSRPPRPASAFPIFAKAVAGGGGRGMRRVERRPTLRDALAGRDARGRQRLRRPDVFLEQAVVDPRHIEVQILADAAGQRRAPLRARLLGAAPPPEGRRDRPGAAPRPTSSAQRDLRATRSRSRTSIGYVNAGTVEFLLDRGRQAALLHRDEPAHPGRAHGHRGGHRRRPRRSRRCASPRGTTLADLGLPRRTRVALRGFALQCRITTEDPANEFRPDTGKITDLPLAGRRRRPPRRRHGVRRRPDQRRTSTRCWSKITCRGRDFDGRGRAAPDARWRSSASAASRRTSRSSRPCSTTRTSRRRPVTTTFIDERPELLAARAARRPRHQAAQLPRRRHRQPAARHRARRLRRPARASCRTASTSPPAPPHGLAAAPLRAGPGGLRDVRCAPQTRARSSPTRPSATRTSRCWRPGCAPATWSRVAPYVARTDPAAALGRGVGRRDLRRGAALPRRGPVGAAGRAARGAPEHLPPDAAARPQHRRLHAATRPRSTDAFVAEAAATGVDIFRDLRRAQRRRADAPGDRRRARDRHRGRGGRALLHRRPARPGRGRSTRSTTTCAWPSRSSTPGPTSSRSRTWPACCARRPRAGSSTRPARALRPAGARAHPRHRGRPARDAARRDRGRGRRRRRGGRLDGRAPPASRSLSALVAALAHTERTRGSRSHAVDATSSRTGRRCARSTRRSSPGLPGPDRAGLHPRDPRRAAVEPAPAGRSRSGWPTASRQVEDVYAAANRMLGRPREGDAVVEGRRRPRAAASSAPAPTRHDFEADPARYDIPDSVIGFLAGELGDLPGGWPEPFRTKALAGRTGKPGPAELDRRRAQAGLAARPRPRR